MWTPLRFTRSPGTGWIWYVSATDGTQPALFPIAAFRSLINQGLANRGPEAPYITDATLARLEAERLTPAEIEARDRAREVQEQITARDQALADAQAQEIQSFHLSDFVPDFAKRPILGVPSGFWIAAAAVVAIVVLRSPPRRSNPRRRPRNRPRRRVCSCN
jgi:hypothetical protein